jgi:hypothetical protein
MKADGISLHAVAEAERDRTRERITEVKLRAAPTTCFTAATTLCATTVGSAQHGMFSGL